MHWEVRRQFSVSTTLKLAWIGEKEGGNHLGKPNLLLRFCYHFISRLSSVRDDILVEGMNVRRSDSKNK